MGCPPIQRYDQIATSHSQMEGENNVYTPEKNKKQKKKTYLKSKNTSYQVIWKEAPAPFRPGFYH